MDTRRPLSVSEKVVSYWVDTRRPLSVSEGGVLLGGYKALFVSEKVVSYWVDTRRPLSVSEKVVSYWVDTRRSLRKCGRDEKLTTELNNNCNYTSAPPFYFMLYSPFAAPFEEHEFSCREVGIRGRVKRKP